MINDTWSIAGSYPISPFLVLCSLLSQVNLLPLLITKYLTSRNDKYDRFLLKTPSSVHAINMGLLKVTVNGRSYMSDCLVSRPIYNFYWFRQFKRTTFWRLDVKIVHTNLADRNWPSLLSWNPLRNTGSRMKSRDKAGKVFWIVNKESHRTQWQIYNVANKLFYSYLYSHKYIISNRIANSSKK